MRIAQIYIYYTVDNYNVEVGQKCAQYNANNRMFVSTEYLQFCDSAKKLNDLTYCFTPTPPHRAFPLPGLSYGT